MELHKDEAETFTTSKDNIIQEENQRMGGEISTEYIFHRGLISEQYTKLKT